MAPRFAPIAIVGRACVLPGALSPAQLWEAVAAGRDLVSAVDAGRWRVEPRDIMCTVDDPLPDRTWTDRGGYVRGFEGVWDPEGFAVPAAELRGLDPLFHWVLHCAREALADAGDGRRGVVDRSRVSAVFGNLGFPTAEMTRYAETRWLAPLVGESSNEPPTDPRNRFMWSGPAALLERALGLAPGVYCLDTACASSLYAIAQACHQLQEGRVDLALAGAVNRSDDLFLHAGFAALKALSRTGQSRPFHADADGLLPAEGAGFVALERLDDARRNGRHIYGIIRGVGLSNDGRGRGMLVPSEAGQTRAIKQAYVAADLDPREVSLLECHATGTTIGDATELRSSAAVFGGAAELPIGSLKSNLGHAITAAGVAGLIKLLEAIAHRERPPTLHTDAPNPALAGTPFRLLEQREPWHPPAGRPRIAGLSAFGFGGNNAHLIVSEDDPSLIAEVPARELGGQLAIVAVAGTIAEAQGLAAIEGALLSGRSLVRDGAASAQTAELELVGLAFPPNDLRRTLPQQLLMLAAAREAADGLRLLELRSEILDRTRAGVFVGMEPDPEVCRFGARGRIESRLREVGVDVEAERAWVEATRDQITAPLDAAAVLGMMPNIPANRINAQLDLGGPSWTVNAGEASGPLALQLACRALQRGELDVAIVGAVDMCCEDTHRAALSAVEGQIGGGRMTAGDAAVVLVLRRLADARAHGEPVLGIIDDARREGAIEIDHAALRERLGRCWAAGRLRDAVAALICARRGASLDGSPWPADGRLRLESLTIEPTAARPELVGFAAADPAQLDHALASARLGGEGPSRAVLLASGPAQLSQRVARARQHLQHGTPTGPGVFVRRAPITGELAFVFAGAGAAYAGMGAELLAALPQLGAAVAERSGALAAHYAQPWPTDEAEVPPLQRLWASSFLSQVHARLATELLGLRPQASIGYSSGESNGLFAAGIWTDPDAMVAACRDSGVFEREIGGELRAVARAWGVDAARWETWTVLAPVTALEAATAEVRERTIKTARVHLSIIHHDHEGVIAGDPDACARVRERVGGRWLRLHYDLAVHVPELAGIAEPWLDLHRWPVTPAQDGRRIYGCAHAGAYVPSTEACAQAILGQADRRLDFRKVIEQAYADGVRVFVELGPQAACSRWIREILGAREAVVVGFDRKGAGVEAVLEASAALLAAGVPCRVPELIAALQGSRSAVAAKPSPRMSVPAHPDPVRLPSRPVSLGAASSAMSVQTMSPAPMLPSVDAIAPAISHVAAAAPAPVPAVVQTPTPVQPSPRPVATPYATTPTSTMLPSNPLAAAVQAQLVELGQMHRNFIAQQASLHQQFLDVHNRSMATLADVARGGARGGASVPTMPVHRVERVIAPTPAPAPTPVVAPAPAPVAAVTPTPVVAPTPAPKPIPKPAPAPQPVAAKAPSKPTRRAPIGPRFDRKQLEIHASGRISEIFGPAFAGQDGFTRQVRMPTPPLLLADRVTGLDAEPMSMKLGTIWTETDVTEDAWYVHQGHMPPGVMIEAGQADLMLISYLGVDAHNKGERVYRLLGCELTYHGHLPAVGETLSYEILLDGHAKTGGTRLMFFHYDCHIGDRPCLSVRKGQAGFFSDQELADSEGCLWRPETQDIVAIGPGQGSLDAPVLLSEYKSFTAEQVRAFAAGRTWECFGDGARSRWDRTRSHTRTPTIAGGDMLLFDRVSEFAVDGGPWKRGYLCAELDIRPDHWFFDGHFFNDPCMPGTLMFEGCFQGMAFYLAALGFTIDRDGWRFEPVPEQPYQLSCRGQVQPHSKLLRCEIFVEEIIGGPQPTIYADVLGTVDGLKAFHGRRIGLQMVPAWPLDQGHPELEGYKGEAVPVARIGDLELGLPAMIACANGRPSLAFGPGYARFDGPMPVARLPNPPYHFISRMVEAEGEFGMMKAGLKVVAEYDIPPDAWYFADNGCRVMPFAVLLEAALQPCGWLASYMGCALGSDIPLKFRNLDGTGTVHAELFDHSDGGNTLRTTVRNKQLSRTASMIIVGFDVECRLGDALVYSLETVFGFFPAAAFENQAGLPTTPEQRATFDHKSEFFRALDSKPSPNSGRGRAQMARPRLLMLDRITHFDPKGGAKGLGTARGEKSVNPGEWFFAAHFYQDPVQPGSLGIEAMIQLLQWTMLELGLDADMTAPRFEAIALDQPMTWKYRGQVVPENNVITTTLELTGHGRDERGAWATADLSLWVDGKRVYEAFGMGMRIVDGEPPTQRKLPHGNRGALDVAQVERFWSRWMEHPHWPGEDLHIGLVDRFVGRVDVADPEGFIAATARGAMFLANHQVAVESLAFSIVVSALTGRPTLAVAKAEHAHTWMGDLMRLCVDYPGIRDPELLTFFERGDAASAQQVMASLAKAIGEHQRSVLVHIEGTRSLDCATPVLKMSGSFIDLALALGVPVIPVRFVGGLPVEPLTERIEFPLGMAKQDIYIGQPMLPEQLAKLPYGERKRLVIEAINTLGVANADERPNPGDPAFAERVAAWQAQRGISQPRAVLRQVLAERAKVCPEVQQVLAVEDAKQLDRVPSAKGRWLARLGHWLLG